MYSYLVFCNLYALVFKFSILRVHIVQYESSTYNSLGKNHKMFRRIVFIEIICDFSEL